MSLLSRPMPLDQADGLRRLFGASRVRFIPVVSNPHVAFGGLMLERVCTAFSEAGVRTLVVDAAERAQAASEATLMDLAEGIEPLSTDVSYLSARGLPVRYVDTHGFTSGFLQALVTAAPNTQVVVVHAPAVDLCRMFSRRDPAHAMRADMRPLLLADENSESVTHAYAAMKLLTQRAGLQVHDLLLGSTRRTPRTDRIAAQLARCGEDFFGAVVRDWVWIDPTEHAAASAPPALRRWAQHWLDGATALASQAPLAIPPAVASNRQQATH
jgi:hypothetical protein